MVLFLEKDKWHLRFDPSHCNMIAIRKSSLFCCNAFLILYPLICKGCGVLVRQEGCTWGQGQPRPTAYTGTNVMHLTFLFLFCHSCVKSIKSQLGRSY
jgi:hypothetical protein